MAIIFKLSLISNKGVDYNKKVGQFDVYRKVWSLNWLRTIRINDSCAIPIGFKFLDSERVVR
jgi:hypothetical protein